MVSILFILACSSPPGTGGSEQNPTEPETTRPAERPTSQPREPALPDPFERPAADELGVRIDAWFWECEGEEWAFSLEAIGPAEQVELRLIQTNREGLNRTVQLPRAVDEDGVWRRFEAELEGSELSCTAYDGALTVVAVATSADGNTVCSVRGHDAEGVLAGAYPGAMQGC